MRASRRLAISLGSRARNIEGRIFGPVPAGTEFKILFRSAIPLGWNRHRELPGSRRRCGSTSNQVMAPHRQKATATKNDAVQPYFDAIAGVRDAVMAPPV